MVFLWVRKYGMKKRSQAKAKPLHLHIKDVKIKWGLAPGRWYVLWELSLSLLSTP